MAQVERIYNEQAVAQRIDGSAGSRKRVAAYCRVSTDNEGQMSSLELQMAAFRTQIELRPDWELASQAFGSVLETQSAGEHTVSGTVLKLSLIHI